MTRVKPARLIAALALLILGVVEFELAVNTTGGQIVDQQLMVGAA
ncbi:MAG: putative rane protein, partial [Rhodococcus erythropolis]|nr:putative rane protein [Rhodococcus erythropolis]